MEYYGITNNLIDTLINESTNCTPRKRAILRLGGMAILPISSSCDCIIQIALIICKIANFKQSSDGISKEIKLAAKHAIGIVVLPAICFFDPLLLADYNSNKKSSVSSSSTPSSSSNAGTSPADLLINQILSTADEQKLPLTQSDIIIVNNYKNDLNENEFTKSQVFQIFQKMLGASSTNINDLKRAYRKATLLIHPDKNKNPQAEEAFKVLSAVYQLVTNSIDL